MVGGERKSLILYPYGVPASQAHKELCSRFAIDLGGDVRRVIDGPFPTLDHFLRYVARVPMMRDGAERGEKPIVLLTRTNPLALTVVHARKRIEAVIPALARATWAVFVDLDEDPFFTQTATSLGSIQGGSDEVAIWTGPDDAAFLLMSPAIVRSTGVRATGRAREEETMRPPAGAGSSRGSRR